jgi:hypothetical protein
VRHIEISAAESPEDTALRAAGPVSPDGRPFFLPARLTFDCGGSDQAATFWLDVTAGRVRLTAHEDVMVWDGRALGYSFATIAAAILRRREVLAGNVTRALQAQAIAHARRWRAEYRRNLNQ